MNMAHAVCTVIALMTASAMANQCSSGGECPSDGKSQNVVSLLQSTLRMNVLEVGGGETATGEAMPRPACAKRKLVINSHVKYGVALEHLVASLKEHKFPLSDCVVFRGGASIQDVLAHPGPRIGPDGMTFVDLTQDNFDLNAFAGLSKYRTHRLVCADMYFYIHDSTQIGPCFPQVFNEIKVSPTEVITPGKSLFSNQCVFGRSVVDKFGSDFEGYIGKTDGFLIERGGCTGKAHPACSVAHYAKNQTVIPARKALGMVDVYHTSKPRQADWYQEWDLYKFFYFQPDQSAPRTDLTLLQNDHKLAHDDSSSVGRRMLGDSNYKWAPSCPRNCAVCSALVGDAKIQI